MKYSFLAALALCVAACTSTAPKQAPAPAPAPAPEAPPAPAPKPQIGDFGLDLAAGKADVKAGDDFFAHANGKWYDTFVIPEDRASYGIFTTLDELSQQRVREIIEQAAAAHPAAGSPQQKIGDFYASYMDQAAIDAAGLKPIQDDLDRIA